MGHIFGKILIRGLSSFSATKTYLSGRERKSTFYSNKRLLLVRHQTNQSSPTVNFHFATFPSDNDK